MKLISVDIEVLERLMQLTVLGFGEMSLSEMEEADSLIRKLRAGIAKIRLTQGEGK